jgi:hypothetical protein
MVQYLTCYKHCNLHKGNCSLKLLNIGVSVKKICPFLAPVIVLVLLGEIFSRNTTESTWYLERERKKNRSKFAGLNLDCVQSMLTE